MFTKRIQKTVRSDPDNIAAGCEPAIFGLQSDALPLGHTIVQNVPLGHKFFASYFYDVKIQVTFQKCLLNYVVT